MAKLSLRHYCHSGTELIQALRNPPDGVLVQLVLWLTTKHSINQEMADALVLGLKSDMDDFRYRKAWSPPPRKWDPQIRTIFGEQTVATISQDFMRDVANAVPVVLVACDERSSYWDMLGTKFAGDESGNPPIFKLPRERLPFERVMATYPFGVTTEQAGHLYARATQHFIVQDQNEQPTKLFLLLAAISPMLYAESFRITKILNEVQNLYTRFVSGESDEFEDEDEDELDNKRLKLRRITEVIEDLLGQFSRYMASEVHSNLSNQPSYVTIVADLRSLMADARRLDTEVRDFKQIRVGELALKESRTSIELSNVQIHEAKGGKFPKYMRFGCGNRERWEQL